MNNVCRTVLLSNVCSWRREQTGADTEAGFIPRTRKNIPKSQRFISRSRYHALSVRRHSQIQHSDVVDCGHYYYYYYYWGDVKVSYRKECPVRVAIFCMLGYFHTITWLREYPCVDTISFTFFDHMRLQTWYEWKNARIFIVTSTSTDISEPVSQCQFYEEEHSSRRSKI